MKDAENSLQPNRQPGPLTTLLDARVEQFYALDAPVAVEGMGLHSTSKLWAEQLSISAPDTEVLLRDGVSNGWLDGQPAAVTRKVGKGRTTYLGAWMDDTPEKPISSQQAPTGNAITTFFGDRPLPAAASGPPLPLYRKVLRFINAPPPAATPFLSSSTSPPQPAPSRCLHLCTVCSMTESPPPFLTIDKRKQQPTQENTCMRFNHLSVILTLQITMTAIVHAQDSPAFHIYAGNTHAHTEFTWSHGEQWAKGDCIGIQTYAPQQQDAGVSTWSAPSERQGDKCPAIFVLKGLQFPTPGLKLRDDWRKFQGPPARHFQLARENGYDFYTTTDHSQEDPFFPSSSDNPTWQRTKQEAAAATSTDFVAIAGFEFSENDGPGGEGHINVLNAEGMLNALQPGVNLPFLYTWLVQQKPNGSGPIVASFNHPGPMQYNDWDYRTEGATGIITMLEVINSNRAGHYPAFVAALDHGWKVAPVSGRDNHGLTGVNRTGARTFVLATQRTKPAILEAMKQRRVYASLDTNIECRYTVNGQMMGSTLQPAGAYVFDINVSDPDITEPGEKISRLDIVRDGGEVVQTWMPPAPAYSVHWKPTVTDAKSHYFFVRVWNAGGGNAAEHDPSKPVAWLAPVWTGRPGVVQDSKHSEGKPMGGSQAN